MSDDLLQPSVGAAPHEPRQKPWRVQSQVWVAFFGGIMAVTAVALMNAERLGIDKRRRWLMAGSGALALAILLAFWLRQPAAPDFVTFVGRARELRIYGRVIAVVLFLLLAALQKPAERHYLVFAAAEYASLWKTGLAVTFALGIVQPLLLAGIAWMVKQ